ncbi:MAG: hypothetical protein EBT20_22485 [Alphaproteobacteria bacterium]|nr:hypothetical protein [Alphaproteobacteria bacterium]
MTPENGLPVIASFGMAQTCLGSKPCASSPFSTEAIILSYKPRIKFPAFLMAPMFATRGKFSGLLLLS